MLAQLMEDLLGLECAGDRLDQHGGADGPARQADRGLGVDKHVVPKARLEMALQLGQVIIRAGAARHELAGVVEKMQAPVEERAGEAPAVEEDMLLLEVPAAGADNHHGGLVLERVGLPLGAREGDGAPDGVAEVDLALDDILPDR